MMGGMISVGTAGARSSQGRGGRPQALSVWIDAQGVTAQVKVFPNAGRTTLEAQRVWQNVLSTLVGT